MNVSFSSNSGETTIGHQEKKYSYVETTRREGIRNPPNMRLRESGIQSVESILWNPESIDFDGIQALFQVEPVSGRPGIRDPLFGIRNPQAGGQLDSFR